MAAVVSTDLICSLGLSGVWDFPNKGVSHGFADWFCVARGSLGGVWSMVPVGALFSARTALRPACEGESNLAQALNWMHHVWGFLALAIAL